jgi:hypothetical protein
MEFSVRGTGVALRLAGEETKCSVRTLGSGRPPADDEVSVVGQAFVDVILDGHEDRWTSFELRGLTVPTDRDATMDLLRVVDATIAEGGFIELLGDMGIAGLPVSRWELMSAPRTIELDPALRESLAPLRRR